MTIAQANCGWAAVMVAAILMMLATTIAAPAQTFKTLVNFGVTSGAKPFFAAPIQGVDGNLYGTTSLGGTERTHCKYGCGIVFRLAPSGALTTLHSFDGTDGANPWASLLLGTDGNLYGTTLDGSGQADGLRLFSRVTSGNCGGVGGCGTIFKVTPQGTLTTLHSFHGADGGTPEGSLVQGKDGNFYGATFYGGASGDGTVFKITPAGVLTTMHSFNSSDGANPLGGLLQAADGNFYGTTVGGGGNASCTDGCGTVFGITPAGTLTTLHNFNGSDGEGPRGALVQGPDGSLYGTSSGGGTYGWGTVFKIAPGGTLTSLYSFDITDGVYPEDPLVMASDGNLYGTTVGGGTGDDGTLFKITPEGTLTTLHSFDSTDGSNPYAGLTQATSGNFYGTTYLGGTLEGGTVFSLGLGLGPFVKPVPAFGLAGNTVIILGTDLNGATAVTFNGTPATFTVVSSTEISTAAPTGATTGPVQVVTPSGTLTSNVNFQVLP
jgi:uncharacterized repeat protein (TIGR03803 family)